VTLAAVIVL